MANEIRVRQGYIGGLLTAALTNVGTTLTSDALAALQVIDTTNHCVLVLDPDGTAGEPEEVWVTAHTAVATTATIVRGKGYPVTIARAHDIDTPFVHTSVVTDFYGAPGGYGLIGYKKYRAGSDVALGSTTSGTFADVDAVNASCSFIVPPSGTVLVRVTALMDSGSAATVYNLNLRDGSGDISLTESRALYNSAGQSSQQGVYIAVITGLTVGASLTWKVGHKRAAGSGTCAMYTGPTLGVFVMEIWAVNGA